MDNEKKYKALVGKIKKAYIYAQTDSTKAVLEDILPELKDNYELASYKANISEKIRKDIIQCISNIEDDFETEVNNVQQQKEVIRTEYERGRADAIGNACKWLSQQGNMLEDCFSDINDFVDLFKEEMEEQNNI